MHFKNMKRCAVPCDVGDCEFGKPDLLVSNILAWDLYQKVSGQVIVAGMGDILGIKFEAIDFLFSLYGITEGEDRVDLFEKIQAIDTVRMKIRSEQIATKMNKSKQK